jgi:Protein of unknown function (DUF3179)
MTTPDSKNRSFWPVFGTLVLAGSSLFLIPAFIIRPFRYQSPKALALALAVREYAPVLTAVAACAALGMALWQWNRVRRVKKTLLAAGILLVVGSATMARMNYFEWMFHPVARPGFEAAGLSKLEPGEMILAVTFGNDARAYPIREMAYHHIVNDVVGGVPVAVTY